MTVVETYTEYSTTCDQYPQITNAHDPWFVPDQESRIAYTIFLYCDSDMDVAINVSAYVSCILYMMFGCADSQIYLWHNLKLLYTN